jgi:glutaredoxin
MQFKVYSKENCPFCQRAVSRLTMANLSFEQLKLNEDFTREELFEKFPNAKTFPQIEYTDASGTVYVGGYTELDVLLNEGL